MLRVYIKQFFRLAVILALLPTIAHAATTPAMFVEGRDYIKVPDAVRNSPEVAALRLADPNKIQVLFFFSYGCHGCEMFHTPFEKWEAVQEKRPHNKVIFRRYPVSFNPQWKMLAKLYYTMEFLDPSGKLNSTIFTSIHKQGLKMWQPAVMQKFFAQYGYKDKDFDAAFNSFGVNRQVHTADEISKAYKVEVTPDVIINGPVSSYRLELSKVDNNVEKFFKVLDYLVAREEKTMS